MKYLNMLLAFMYISIFLACSKSDEGSVAVPQVRYEQQIKANFYNAGNSETPEVNWNGDIGKFGLQQAIEGLTIDENTGVLSWSKFLPVGNHKVNAIVFNNLGSNTVAITIDNPLLGKFKGNLFPNVTIQGDKYNLEFDFKEDGMLEGFTQLTKGNGEIEGPFELFGSFIAEKDEVSGTFQYEEVADPTPFAGFIKQTEQKAVLMGKYHPNKVCETEICYSTTFELQLIVE